MPPEDKSQPQGNPGPQSGQGDGEAPKYLTAEDVNKAISARFSAFEKKIESKISTLNVDPDAIVAKILEALPKSEAPAGKTEKTAQGSIEDTPAYKGMQKQLEEQRKQTEAIKAERDAEKARSRDTSLRQKTAEVLAKAGIDPTAVNDVVGILVDSKKRVRFLDETSDEIVFGDGRDDVDLETGAQRWVKTDDAKRYLPPRGISGSGDQRGRGSNGQKQPQAQRGEAGMAFATGVLEGGMSVQIGGRSG